jgi:hypothetical protein
MPVSIAARIWAVGRVTVSGRKSMMEGIAFFRTLLLVPMDSQTSSIALL